MRTQTNASISLGISQSQTPLRQFLKFLIVYEVFSDYAWAPLESIASFFVWEDPWRVIKRCQDVHIDRFYGVDLGEGSVIHNNRLESM